MLNTDRCEMFNLADGLVSERNNGAFLLQLPSAHPEALAWFLLLIVSDADGEWEHVSVTQRKIGDSNVTKIPSWTTMCFVKEMLWDDPEDVVMQLHPARSQYVNRHPHCLHLWRPLQDTIPTPPKDFVG